MLTRQTLIACISVVFILSVSCQNQHSKQVEKACYYWRSVYGLSAPEKAFLQINSIKKLYVKYADIAVQKGVVQEKSTIIFQKKIDTSLRCVPVFFITNRSLVGANGPIIKAIVRCVLQKLKMPVPYREVQIDCDWSPSTREAYFGFLRMLRDSLPKSVSLSATIRLHQIKFPNITGIPPVQRGMLMCYNMADWQHIKTRNSLFDPQVIAQYTQQLRQYPLNLDVVMPIFAQTVVFRNGKFLVFFNQKDKTTLQPCNFLKEVDSRQFMCVQDTLVWGVALRKGDLLRAEGVAMSELSAETERIISEIRNPSLTFALFHLDTLSLQHYSHESLTSFLRSLP